MKKIAILATVAALPLTLAACGEKASDATAASKEQTQASDPAAPMDVPPAAATASDDQGSNDQGSNDQGGKEQ